MTYTRLLVLISTYKPHYENVPRGWTICTLEDISHFIRNGLTLKQTKNINGFPITRIESISKEVLDFDKMGYADLIDEEKYRPYFLQANDILFSHINSPIYVGKVALCDNIATRKIVHGMNLLCIRVSELVNSKFILYAIRSSIYRNAMRPFVQNAVNQASISINNVKNVPFPLPPLAEQTRIVEEIDKWLELIDSIETNQQELQKFIQQTKSKVLDLAIHGKLVPQDPNDEPAIELLKRINPHFTPCDTSHYENLPETWCVAHMSEEYNHTTGKALKKADMTGELRQYITTSNVYWNSFDFTEVRSMYFTEKELDKCTAHKGDLLVCNGGDVGRAAIWDYDYDICYQNHISRLRPISVDIVFNPFYSYLFRYLKDKGQLNGKGVAITSLSAADIQSLAIPVPPLVEQKRIVERIETIFAQLDTITAEL